MNQKHMLLILAVPLTLFALRPDRAKARKPSGDLARVTSGPVEASLLPIPLAVERAQGLGRLPEAPDAPEDWARTAPPVTWAWKEPLKDALGPYDARMSPTGAFGAVSGRQRVVSLTPAANGDGKIRVQHGDGRVEDTTLYATQQSRVNPPRPKGEPLIFDLAGTGAKTVGKRILWDLDGAGNIDAFRWINDLEQGTGLLVFDADKDGKAGEDGRELFGDRTDFDGDRTPDGYSDGFLALRTFADRAVRDGVIPALVDGKLDAARLAALEKAYGLKMKVGGFKGEPVSLAKAGVSEIALSREPAARVYDFDGYGNDIAVQLGAVFRRADGSVGHYMDLWLIEAPLRRVGAAKFRLALSR